MRYLQGLFTPTGAIVCPPCHNASECATKRGDVEPIVSEPGPDDHPGTCDHCGSIVLLPGDLSLEQAVVRDLKYWELPASMAQTGGMNSAAELLCPDGSTLYATADEDEPGKVIVYRYKVTWPSEARLAEWHASGKPLGWLELEPDDAWGDGESLTMRDASLLMRGTYSACHWQGARWGQHDPTATWDSLAEALWSLRSAGVLWDMTEDPDCEHADAPDGLRERLARFSRLVIGAEDRRDEAQTARFRNLVKWAVSTIGEEVF